MKTARVSHGRSRPSARQLPCDQVRERSRHSDYYAAYRVRVPRLVPALRPRTPSAGRQPHWASGFKAEAWYWGFAAAIATFAATLSVKLFFVILSASIATLWVVTSRSG